MASVNCRIRFRWYAAPIGALALLSTVTLLGGCGPSFFQCEGKPSCPATPVTPPGTGSGGSGNSVDYAYVSNSVTGPTYINGYTLGSGSLVAASGTPFSLGFSPVAMAVTPSNSYLYMASDAASNAANPGVGNIYGYSIGTGGALSTLPIGDPLENESATSIAISPDGQWLFALNTDTLSLEEYSVTNATGLLTAFTSYPITGKAGQPVTPASVKVAPGGGYIVVSLGTAGAETLYLNTTTGMATLATQISPPVASSGIFAAAFDSNNYLYCVGTSGLQVFSTATGGGQSFMKTYTTGKGARSIVINAASTFLYVGNEADATISGYAIGMGGALTPITGSPFAAPKLIGALARDSTGAYIVASGYDSASGIQLFSIGSTGILKSVGSAGSGVAQPLPPAAIAATH
jgi:6-phosphogluconolactonase